MLAGVTAAPQSGNDAIGLRQTAVRVVALLLADSVSWAQAADPPAAGRVVAITDGDTLTVLDDADAQHKVRLGQSTRGADRSL